MRCANAFIADVTETGIVYADKLPTLTMGQMIELLPLYNDAGIESVVNVFASGEANNRMSTKTLRDVVSRARAITTRGEEVDSDNTKSSEVSPMEKAVKLSNKKVEHNKAYFSTIIAGIGDMLNMLNDDLLEQGYSFTEIGNVQVSIEELEKAISTIAD